MAQHGQNVFATWEFASTWWKHFGRGRTLLTVAGIDAAGEVAAIFPCYLWKRRPLRVVRFLGNGAGDVLGPICQPEQRPYMAEAVRRLLDRPLWDWDVFVGENLPGDEPWASHLQGRVLRHEGNPVARLTGTFDDYLRGRSANFRHQARARERRLRDRYTVRFRLCTDPDRLDRDLDTLFRLHLRRFGKHSAFTGGRRGFTASWRTWPLSGAGFVCGFWSSMAVAWRASTDSGMAGSRATTSPGVNRPTIASRSGW